MDKLEFGYECKDIITGFKGILKSRYSFITGCDRVELIKKDKENESKIFDVPVVKILGKGVFEELKEIEQCNAYDDIDEALYEFGTLAKDKITGFEGKIVAKSLGISGDITYALSPKFEKDNKENDSVWFDESRIEVIDTKKEEIQTSPKRTGGAVPSLKYR